jgi:hypothetical protein
MNFDEINNRNDLTQLSGSNYCGGYALASILYNKGDFEDFAINAIYKAIQDVQAGYNDFRKEFLNNHIGNNKSKMSLPSAIVSVAEKNGWNSCIHYNSKTLMSYMGKELVEAEENVLKNKTEGTGYLPPQNEKTAHIVLVDQGIHWIAVVFDGQKNWLYDSGDGTIIELTGRFNSRYAGLYIELSLK